MSSFAEELATQRWDDHRYYHHCRINQSLHFVSAISFLVAYVLLFIEPAAAGLLGWIVSMGTRQSGHFFFEPRGYDDPNQATHEHKEAIKLGYNLQRKRILMALWAATPLLLWADPTLFGTQPAAHDLPSFLHHLGLLWLGLGVAGLVGRTLQLCVTKGVQTGLVWMTKILTDPINDIRLYHKAPLHLWRGERLDPAHGQRPATGAAH